MTTAAGFDPNKWLALFQAIEASSASLEDGMNANRSAFRAWKVAQGRYTRAVDVATAEAESAPGLSENAMSMMIKRRTRVEREKLHSAKISYDHTALDIEVRRSVSSNIKKLTDMFLNAP